ncbi:15226_t:CDS:2 [Funneliformis mosseae]|uniref:15226_t:CDS:1 n=1 Tax=Funneliformis mosseae TaxID=27381 RepID=A0A9N9ADJ6_FUNMO|nr:15226_t:CDS:2 [Funneliformis mosseae]
MNKKFDNITDMVNIVNTVDVMDAVDVMDIMNITDTIDTIDALELFVVHGVQIGGGSKDAYRKLTFELRRVKTILKSQIFIINMLAMSFIFVAKVNATIHKFHHELTLDEEDTGLLLRRLYDKKIEDPQ